MEGPAFREIPPLTAAHLDNARLFASRYDMIAQLGIGAGGVVTEVGVALGDFSQFILDTLKPSRFVAIDTFDMRNLTNIWGRTSAEVFAGKTHEEFYRDRFASEGERVKICTGLSDQVLAGFPDHSFDFIYVDAYHSYEAVRDDAVVASRKIKPNGVVVFNDYTTFDRYLNAPYGVVEAVNELVVAGSWKVIGFGLEKNMFCDIAVRRSADQGR